MEELEWGREAALVPELELVREEALAQVPVRVVRRRQALWRGPCPRQTRPQWAGYHQRPLESAYGEPYFLRKPHF